jgi:pimeloyl-ACP methyl ester carboxylesterase
MTSTWIAAVFVVALAASLAGPAAAEELISLPTRSGVTQPFYVTRPETPPLASLILFTGGDGKLGQYGPVDHSHGNFLVRSRDRFVARGFVVAVIDVPSDESGGMSANFRNSIAHRGDIATVIAYLRHAFSVPVWLVGTSMGTISAANGATLDAGGADGVVLTSSVMRSNKKVTSTVFDSGPNLVRIPTLIVHNRDDGCVVCPFGQASELLSRFTAAPRKQLIAFEGGAPPISDPCEALSRHGYIGIEDKVVAAIADWITAKP